LQERIAAYPQEASLHHARGLAWERAARRESALGALRKVQQLARDPANREVRMALASYLQAAGKTQEGASLLSDLQLINPFDPLLRARR
jgi:predicted Zn-dependent protease